MGSSRRHATYRWKRRTRIRGIAERGVPGACKGIAEGRPAPGIPASQIKDTVRGGSQQDRDRKRAGRYRVFDHADKTPEDCHGTDRIQEGGQDGRGRCPSCCRHKLPGRCEEVPGRGVSGRGHFHKTGRLRRGRGRRRGIQKMALGQGGPVQEQAGLP